MKLGMVVQTLVIKTSYQNQILNERKDRMGLNQF